MLYKGAAINGVEKAACFVAMHWKYWESSPVWTFCGSRSFPPPAWWTHQYRWQWLSDVSIKVPVVALRFFTASKTYSYKQGVAYHIILAHWLSLYISGSHPYQVIECKWDSQWHSLFTGGNNGRVCLCGLLGGVSYWKYVALDSFYSFSFPLSLPSLFSSFLPFLFFFLPPSPPSTPWISCFLLSF